MFELDGYLVLQRHFVIDELLSMVVTVACLGLSAAPVVRPCESDCLRDKGCGHVYQETADLCRAEGDQVVAAFGSAAAVTAR